ncbi:nucleotidyl transferase AbiEii/AbiGii toxin family protein [Catenulispora pinisilvae]|uniref:nucleotidyl transferase AbiEii/AbiGii toxin family protein n=1 Tax=Catenulispora pinisilvae TaxID=2705253 RepID=UPI001891794E|nr:nucleotidyl transferase AbiEii/AbiGii toxin family protein [Catenulispora pinisilvae]
MSATNRDWHEDYPPTLKKVAAEGVSQDLVFDPAMKQHARAYRAGDPRFSDPGRGAQWYGTRMVAMAAALSAVAECDFGAHLVLRGSVLMKLWFGADAREPGDLDFVVDHRDWSATDARTDELFDQVAAGAEVAADRDGIVRVDRHGALSDEIWTYDRVPGRRLVLPWSAEGCPDGTVQLDFVFGEELPEPAKASEFWFAGSVPTTMRAVSPELSLAWKLLWLATDSYPQGKDLYDAVLLAEAVHVPFPLLRDAFAAEPYGESRIVQTLTANLRDTQKYDDWVGFQEDHPDAVGGPEALVRRLLTALEPTFAEAPGASGS